MSRLTPRLSFRKSFRQLLVAHLAATPRQGESSLGDECQRLGNLGCGERDEELPGALRLAAATDEAGDGLEVGLEHHGSVASRDVQDQIVDGSLGWDRLLSRLGVAVVDGEERNSDGETDA